MFTTRQYCSLSDNAFLLKKSVELSNKLFLKVIFSQFEFCLALAVCLFKTVQIKRFVKFLYHYDVVLY